MPAPTRSIAVALLLTACSGGPRDAVGERAGGTQPSWNVPEHTCAAGIPHLDVADDGSIRQFCHDGKALQSTLKKWHPNSQKAAQGEYHNGARVGIWKWWHDNGQMAIRGPFEADRESATWTWWHPNGQTHMRGDHVDGKRMGVWQTWYATGQLQHSGHFRNGRKDGVWETWNVHGELARKETWDLGRMVTETVLIEPDEEQK